MSSPAQIPDRAYEALRAVNYYRRLAHLPPATLDARICKAAQNHAHYRKANPKATESAHDETPGLTGFTGKRPADRMTAAGYRFGCSGECMSGGFEEAPAAVSGLIEVPYHRIPFFAENLTLGIGFENFWWVFDFDGTSRRPVVWPPDGAKGVPTVGDFRESPDPMRIHPGAPTTIGYVVTATFPESDFTVLEATLTDSRGQNVPVLINGPQNDDMSRDIVVMMPTAVLQAQAGYRAMVHVRSRTGQIEKVSWSFTTGSRYENFDYALRCMQYPHAQPKARKFIGYVESLSEDQSTMVVSGLADSNRGFNGKPSKIRRSFKITTATKLRHDVDRLGIDMERVIPGKGAKVRFSVLPKDPLTIDELLIVR